MATTPTQPKLSQPAWLLLTFAAVGVLGFLDYITGPELSFSIFYLLPTSVAAWHVGFRGGLAIALASAVVWFLAEYFWNVAYSHPLIPYWNALVRLGFFVLTVWLIGRTQALNQSLNEKAASLSEQIAERIRAEEALAESQKFYRLITENASDLIAVLDIQGRQLYCSPSFHRILSDKEPTVGADFFARIHAEDQDQVRAAHLQTIQTGLNQRVDYRVRTEDSSLRYFESEWNLVQERPSAPHNVVVVSRDVTLRKRTEALYANEKEILELIAQGRPLQAVLRGLIEKIEGWSDRLSCSVLVRGAEGEAVLHEASSGIITPGGATSEGNKDHSAAADSPCSPAVEWARCRQSALEAGLELAFSKEILSTSGEILGFLTIFSRGRQETEALRLQLYEKAANMTAIALERQRTEEMLRRLSNMIQSAQEAERRRVARELHDSVNQILSSAAFRVEVFLGEMASADQSMRQELGKVRFLLQKAIHEVRHISRNLRPSELDELGLIAALRALSDDFQDRNEWDLELRLPTDQRRFSGELELALYRIVQEAYTNIQKHSEASRVGLTLDWDKRFVTLTVRDNGQGIAPGSGREKEGKKPGMGLVDMKERCGFLGGSFSLRSVPAEGTEIVVRIPVAPAQLRTATFGESGSDFQDQGAVGG